MNFFRRFLLAVGFAGTVLAFSLDGAVAADRATVTASVNLRAGPGSKYQSLGTVPKGDIVSVYSCQSGFAWCSVDHRGKRGYLAGRYLAYASQGEYYGELYSSIGIYLGVPIFWDDYPIYRPPGSRPPGSRPPDWRPPGNRPPNWRPPGDRPPGVRPPRPSHPIYRPPSYSRPSVGGGYGGRGGSFGGGGGRGSFGGGGGGRGGGGRR